jgi:hypothetical protein
MVAMIATHTKTPELMAMGQKIQLSQSGGARCPEQLVCGQAVTGRAGARAGPP